MKKPRFFEDMNMFAIGLFIGCLVTSAFVANYYKGETKSQVKIIKAYEQYYNKVETMLDSIDENRGLNLMDTDLCSDYGVNYLNAKGIVDSLTMKYKYYE